MSDFSSPNGLNSKVCFRGPSTSYEEENELLLIEITKSRGAEVFLFKVKFSNDKRCRRILIYEVKKNPNSVFKIRFPKFDFNVMGSIFSISVTHKRFSHGE